MSYANEHALEGHRLYIEKDYEAAEAALRRAIAQHPDDFHSHQRLTRALFRQGKHKPAQSAGLATLRLKDQAALAAFAALPRPLALRNAAKPFEPTARARNIISFGLWGDEAKYCARAIKNVEIAQFIYPEWTCRFYCDHTVPRETIDELTRLVPPSQ